MDAPHKLQSDALVQVSQLIRPGPLRFLLPLGKPFTSAPHVKEALGLSYLPIVHEAEKEGACSDDDEEGSNDATEDVNDASNSASTSTTTYFIELLDLHRQQLTDYLQLRGHSVPYLITINKAAGTYRDTQIAAPTSMSEAQLHGFPRTYFFYGSLADPIRLASALEVREDDARARLRPVSVRGYRLARLGDYLALADGQKLGAERDGQAMDVEGMACQVRDWEEVERLAVYETRVYEVVRVRILLSNGNENANEEFEGFTFVAAGLGRENGGQICIWELP